MICISIIYGIYVNLGKKTFYKITLNFILYFDKNMSQHGGVQYHL